MKIGAIIQARASSTRLPGKIFKELPYESGISVLEHVIKRIKKSKNIDTVILATTTNKADDPILDIAVKENVEIYRGSEMDVLERYYGAAKENMLDIVIRITSDCPFIDWNIVDAMIDIHLKARNDYTANTLERTFPHGMDAEVFTFKTLEEAYKNAKDKFEREHVTPYIYKSNPEKYKIYNLQASADQKAPEIRITVDTQEDYNLACAVYDYLYSKNQFFGIDDIVNLFQEKKWLLNLNSNIVQKKICTTIEEEYEEATSILEKQELLRINAFLKERYNER
jgi:spore coat polysaccharide biosynthesis protein SpsF